MFIYRIQWPDSANEYVASGFGFIYDERKA